MAKLPIIKELWEFTRTSKKWWLTPLVLILVLFGLLVVLVEGSALAPLIYTIF